MKYTKTTIEDLFNLLFNRKTAKAKRIEKIANKITFLPLSEAMILFEAMQKATKKMGMVK
jgi:hypothetical protein